ncbi:hypothetical protein vseg_000224 [Gypsophila vaccaria]
MAALTAAANAVHGGGHLLSPPFLPRLNLKPPPHHISLPSSSSSYSLFHSLSAAVSATRLSSAGACGGRLRVSARGGGKSSDDDQIVDFSSIRSDKVRLIDEQQNMVGIVSRGEAIRRAEDSELDLVVVSPDSDPPVVRIMNYDKYRYEQQKKKREQQKKSAASRMDLKELKMGYNIDVHDYSVRLKAAQKFLKDGDKVKVIVNLKGRGNVFLEKAIQLIRKFQTDLGELATEENNNFARRKREEITERFIYMIIVPNKNVLQKTQETPKKKISPAPNEVSAAV